MHTLTFATNDKTQVDAVNEFIARLGEELDEQIGSRAYITDPEGISDLLRDQTRTNSAVEIDYVDALGVPTNRVFYPDYVGDEHVFGYNNLDETEFRSFKLNRISRAAYA